MALEADKASRRHSLRLDGFDYSTAGGYFITICTRNRISILGAIEQGEVRLSRAGLIVSDSWLSLPGQFPYLTLDAFVVMPNHVHGVVVLADSQLLGRSRMPKPLGSIIRTFKAASTRRIRKAGLADFAWQADYYDHILRSERELDRVRRYIEANPARWGEDPENPVASRPSRAGQTEPWEE